MISVLFRKTNITALKNLELHMGSPLRPNPSNPPRHETAETSHQTTAGRDVSCLCRVIKRTVRVTPVQDSTTTTFPKERSLGSYLE